MKISYSNIIWATIAATAVLLSAAVAIANVTQNYSCFTSECWRRQDVAAHPRLLPDVALQNATGDNSQLSDLRGKVLVVNFVYTRCATICNTLGSVSSQLATRFAPEIKKDKVEVVSISFDPNRDSAGDLQAYSNRLDRSHGLWQVVRPTSEVDNATLKNAFGIAVINDGFGGFDHNAALHIVDKTGHLVSTIHLANLIGQNVY
jgi:protein SCO1